MGEAERKTEHSKVTMKTAMTTQDGYKTSSTQEETTTTP